MVGTLVFFTLLGIALVTVGTYAASAGEPTRTRDTWDGFRWAVGAAAVIWTFIGVVWLVGS